MRIGIVTYHRSPSYGACLQAYATQQILKKIVKDVTIIDYLNRYEQRVKKVVFSSDGTIMSGVKNAIKSIVFRRKRLLKKAFGKFAVNYNLTETSYKNSKGMQNLNFDVLVVGSDQVWNPKVSGELDNAFLLDFGNPQKRISIASSFGSYSLNEGEKKVMKEALKRFDAISVREQFAAEQIQCIGIKNVKVISDPTILVPVSEWNSLLEETTYKNYILTYFVSASYYEFSDIVSEIKGDSEDRIFNIQSSDFHWKGVDKTLVGVTPEEFLGLIKSADLIITDSFHGTVFSILFHKKFVHILNENNPIRTKELLDTLNLNHYIYPYVRNINDINEYRFQLVDKQIEEMRNDAQDWIAKALGFLEGDDYEK